MSDSGKKLDMTENAKEGEEVPEDQNMSQHETDENGDEEMESEVDSSGDEEQSDDEGDGEGVIIPALEHRLALPLKAEKQTVLYCQVLGRSSLNDDVHVMMIIRISEYFGGGFSIRIYAGNPLVGPSWRSVVEMSVDEQCPYSEKINWVEASAAFNEDRTKIGVVAIVELHFFVGWIRSRSEHVNTFHQLDLSDASVKTWILVNEDEFPLVNSIANTSQGWMLHDDKGLHILADWDQPNPIHFYKLLLDPFVALPEEDIDMMETNQKTETVESEGEENGEKEDGETKEDGEGEEDDDDDDNFATDREEERMYAALRNKASKGRLEKVVGSDNRHQHWVCYDKIVSVREEDLGGGDGEDNVVKRLSVYRLGALQHGWVTLEPLGERVTGGLGSFGSRLFTVNGEGGWLARMHILLELELDFDMRIYKTHPLGSNALLAYHKHHPKGIVSHEPWCVEDDRFYCMSFVAESGRFVLTTFTHSKVPSLKELATVAVQKLFGKEETVHFWLNPLSTVMEPVEEKGKEKKADDYQFKVAMDENADRAMRNFLTRLGGDDTMRNVIERSRCTQTIWHGGIAIEELKQKLGCHSLQFA